MAKHPNHKIIFGLKVKQLRLEKGMSLKQVSELTGLSQSYLNEIEKGKKYPKIDKIKTIASALESTESELTSLELKHNLAPIGALLKSNFLNDLPLDLFGIELSKVVEIIANSPLKVGAFISTLVELSRTYAVQEENFYHRALRAYQELHNNYFEDIETEVDRFIKMYDIPVGEAVPPQLLSAILKNRFGYKIEEKGLDKFPELSRFRSLYIPKKKKLLLNGKLNNEQKAFLFAKELGFCFLRLKERPYTTSFHKVNSFDEALNNYKAGYFAVAILVNRESFIRDVQNFFGQKKWNPQLFQQLTEKYHASATVLFQRFNIVPQFFDLENMFFIRFFHNLNRDIISIDKELHLNRKHYPHSNGLQEHYCRRWSSTSMLYQLKEQDDDATLRKPIFDVQLEQFHGTDDEYLCMTIAQPSYPATHKNSSITLGVLIDDKARKAIKFLDDPAIPRKQVHATCERCPIADCNERAAPPVFIQKKERHHLVEERLSKLLK